MPAGYGVGGYSTGTGTSAGGIASPEGVDNESIGGGGVGPGEGPSNGGNVFSKIGNFVKGIVSGTPQKNQRTVPSSQNFLQGSLPKGYTISKSGNTVYAPTTPTARERAENQFTGIDPNVAFRGAVAGIDPVTGMMWSGGTKGGALDQYTKSMMTPQRVEQNRSRTAKYADRSNKMRGQLRGSGVVPRTGKEGAFGFLDLDKDGGIFTSTNPYGTVYGMSNKAIYDPSLPEAYRGIPGTYAAKSGEPQKTSEDRMLANEIMSYVMPGAGIVRGVNWAKGKLAPKTETEPVANKGMTDNQFTNFIGGLNFSTDDEIPFSNMTPTEKQNFRNLPKSEFPVTTIKPDDLATSSNFNNMIYNDPYGNPMYSNNPIVGYQMDGKTPIYANDPDASQYPYASVYP